MFPSLRKNRASRSRDEASARRGFTLIELLIVVAIIGLIAALLVPNLLDALQKGKQKKTMGDIRITGTAMMSWLTDEFAAAAAGASTVDISDWSGTADLDVIRSALIPAYVQEVPERDGWRNTYSYRLDIGNPASENVAMAASGGRDGSLVAGIYTVGGFDPTDYDQDIVWADGKFIRRPEKQ